MAVETLTKDVAMRLLVAIADELEGLGQPDAAKTYRRVADIVADIELPRVRRRRRAPQSGDATAVHAQGPAPEPTRRPGRRRRSSAA